MRELVADACAIFRAGVAAVSGQTLVRSCVQFDSTTITVGEFIIARDSVNRIIVVGAGKASGTMAAGLVEQLSPEIEIVGHVNVPDGCQQVALTPDWPPDLTLFPARPAGVNEPTATAIRGTDRIIQWVREAGSHDLVVVLISGGGSALLCRPIAGVSLNDKLAVTRHLSGNGADIAELNTVRKHLSEVKGGGLLKSCRAAAAVVTLVLSDVLGDPLDLIASGPTVPDPTAPADALAILSRFDPNRKLPTSVYEALQSSSQSRVLRRNEKPGSMSERPDAEVTVIGNNAVAVDAAGIEAESRGYNHVMHASRQCEGEAEAVGEHLADMTLDMLCRDKSLHRQDALITGGEPVVKLAEASVRGRGGRNQQLVLAAYRRLLQIGLTDEQWSRLVLLSGGTDGEDGPTDAAGAYIDGRVHRAAIANALTPDSFLDRNDAYTFFEQTGGLLLTGPTGTNVCDLRVALVDA